MFLFLCRCWILWNWQGGFPILVFLEEGRGLLSTPSLALTAKQNPIDVAFQSEEKAFSVVVEVIEKLRAGRV